MRHPTRRVALIYDARLTYDLKVMTGVAAYHVVGAVAISRSGLETRFTKVLGYTIRAAYAGPSSNVQDTSCPKRICRSSRSCVEAAQRQRCVAAIDLRTW